MGIPLPVRQYLYIEMISRFPGCPTDRCWNIDINRLSCDLQEYMHTKYSWQWSGLDSLWPWQRIRTRFWGIHSNRNCNGLFKLWFRPMEYITSLLNNASIALITLLSKRCDTDNEDIYTCTLKHLHYNALQDTLPYYHYTLKYIHIC